jgi:hypothetical protein
MKSFVNFILPEYFRLMKESRWAEHVTRNKGNAYTVLLCKSEEKGPLGRCRCRWDNTTILKWILMKMGMRMWTGFYWQMIGL